LNGPAARGNFAGVSKRHLELEPVATAALFRSGSFDPKTLQVDVQVTTGERTSPISRSSDSTTANSG
jgi:hypothetical protein